MIPSAGLRGRMLDLSKGQKEGNKRGQALRGECFNRARDGSAVHSGITQAWGEGSAEEKRVREGRLLVIPPDGPHATCTTLLMEDRTLEDKKGNTGLAKKEKG